MGRGEAGGFTVPAMNLRMMTYYTARAAFRAAKAAGAGAFIFEIARSEIGYTEQRPHEYAARILAAALREGFDGPVFFQGDHVQVNAKKYASPDRDKELETLRTLIREEIAAGFYNIDIDTSTLVDLDKTTLDEQQAGELRPVRGLHGVHPRARAGGRHRLGRRRDRRGRRQELRRPRAARVHARLPQGAGARAGAHLVGHQQDQRADRHGARRLRRAPTARCAPT